jgi:hypothetical protein
MGDGKIGSLAGRASVIVGGVSSCCTIVHVHIPLALTESWGGGDSGRNGRRYVLTVLEFTQFTNVLWGLKSLDLTCQTELLA